MIKVRDLTKENPFGRLTVIKRAENDKWGNRRCLCECVCGNIKTINESSLISGGTQSCGCMTKGRHATHGMTKTPEYGIWGKMKDRCYKRSDGGYKHYGGRGIAVCDRWLIFFENFITDMGLRPSLNHSIERKDNNGDYEPGNCKWATCLEQNQNKRNNRIFIAISPSGVRHKSKCQRQFARDHNLSQSGIYNCLASHQEKHKGWSFFLE